MKALHWDIFCHVIDNFGDVGVCWRLARHLAERGKRVRLWVDEEAALTWMAPQGWPHVELRHWQRQQAMPADAAPADVVIEAFGCEIDHHWIACGARTPAPNSPQSPVWINLEYLSAQALVQRLHGLVSPVLSGPARGLHKWFFYPGFTAGTGGLLPPSAPTTVPTPTAPTASNTPSAAQRISLFCYEPQALQTFLLQQAQQDTQTEILAFEGRSHNAALAAMQRLDTAQPHWNKNNKLALRPLAYLPQTDYDALLRECDFNCVRGEDSLVQALWAGRAFVWHIYPQSDGAHEAKLAAFLAWLGAPQDWIEFHRAWNGLQAGPLPPLRLQAWTDVAQEARTRLRQQPDLVSQLIDFVEERLAPAN